MKRMFDDFQHTINKSNQLTLLTGSIGPMTCTSAGSSANRTETGVDRRRSRVVRLMRDDFRLC